MEQNAIAKTSSSPNVRHMIKTSKNLLMAGALVAATALTPLGAEPASRSSRHADTAANFTTQESNLGRRVHGGGNNPSGGNKPAGTSRTSGGAPPAGGGNRGGTNTTSTTRARRQPSGRWGTGRTATGRAVTPAAATGGVGVRQGGTRQQPGATYVVTLFTGAARTPVYLDERLIALSGADAKLVVKLRPGTYTARTKLNGSMTPPQTLNVAANAANTFNLTGGAAAAARVNNATTPPESVAATTAAPPSAAATTATATPSDEAAEDILKRYSDPKRTDSVTEADWQRVLEISSAALTQHPFDARLKAQVLFAQGQLAFLRGNYPDALSAFNSSALALPTSALAYYGLGNAYVATNQPSEAVRAYGRAIELNGEFAAAHKGMGEALTRLDKTKEAQASYERARALGYSSPGASLGLARTLMARERWAEALKELEEVAKAKPTAEVYLSIGDCYVEMKQPLSAAKAYQRATELDPKSALAAYKYGELMYDAREYAAAAEALERALALDQTGMFIRRDRAREMANKAAARLNKSK